MITVEPMPNLLNKFTLRTWLIQGPFHPIWTQWMCSLVHLRGEHEGAAARLQFPGATHELIIFAQDPKIRLSSNAIGRDLRPLTPVDVCQQLRAADDAAALRTVEAALLRVREGRLSPDQDYRGVWRTMLAGDPPGSAEWAAA